MKKQKYYLAAGGLLCSGLLSLAFGAPATHAATAEESAVAAVMNSLQTVYQAAIDEYNSANPDEIQLQLSELEERQAASVAHYKPETLNAYVQLNRDYYLEVTTVDDISASGFIDTNSIVEALDGLGFAAYGPIYAWPPTQQYINTDTGVICSVDAAGSDCGHISWLSITDEWAAFANGIGAAFHESEEQYPVILAHVWDNSTLPLLYNSEYTPYQYTFVGISNYRGMFYRASATSDWVYFGGTQSVLDCSEYTGEAEKGFMGYICYNGTEESTVGAASAITTVTDAGPVDDSGSVSAPDTGASTGDNQGAIVATSAAAIASISIITYLAIYIKKRLSSRVHF